MAWPAGISAQSAPSAAVAIACIHCDLTLARLVLLSICENWCNAFRPDAFMMVYTERKIESK